MFKVNFPDEIQEKFHGFKVLVTGGTGMIGREVCRILVELGADVTSASLDDLKIGPKIRYIKGDLSSLEFCLDITSNIDYVFHVAGVKGSVVVTQEKPASFFVPLLMMNTNILEASRRNCCKKLLYTSSIGAYSSREVFVEDEDTFDLPPMDMFPGWAKRMAELQVQAYQKQYGMDNFAIVRPSNIYGPGDNFDEQNAMVIPSLMARVLRGDNPVSIWGDGSAERDFLHATDAARGIILALAKGTAARAINLGSGYGITIKYLVESLQKIVPFEAYFDLEKPSGFKKRVMDGSLAKKVIGFVPEIDIDHGLKNTWSWFVENSTEHASKNNYFRE